MPSLFVIQGRDQGRRFELDQRVLTIGRDASNAIQLHDTEVSRRHAEFRVREQQTEVVDLNSSNGTFVNGAATDRALLTSGDRLQIGRTLMIYTGSPQGSQGASEFVQITPQGIGDSRIIRSVPQELGEFPWDDRNDSSSWLARARSNLQVMYRTALAVSHTMDIEQLLAKIMELIFEWIQADRGCIMLAHRDSGELEVKTRRDRHGTHDERIHISRTILDYVRDSQQGVLTSDAREDQRFDAAGSIITMGVREAMCVPMQGRYGMVGVIYVDTFTSPGKVLESNHANRFQEEHLKLMVAIGHQAALAIEDTSYYSAMVQAERLAAIGQTIAGLSHHVKNILQGIRGGSYLIEEGLKANDAEVTRKGWRIVEKNQERISTLVMDMLTFSKDRQPEMSPCALNAIVEDVLELMQGRAAEFQVELQASLQAGIPDMMFDGEGIHRAVLNIVTNAIDACSSVEQPKVEVKTVWQTADARLQVIVHDNGPGVADEDKQRIFTVFESDKGNRGTGLGLPVSLKILHEHDGDIQVESTLGAGASFILHWPAVPVTTESEQAITHDLESLRQTGVIAIDPQLRIE